MRSDRDNPCGTEASSGSSLFGLLVEAVLACPRRIVCALRPLPGRPAGYLVASVCVIHALFGNGPEVFAQPVITQSTFQSTNSAPIPWNEIGAKATAQYSGDGLSVTATATGARINCVFQKLEAQATSEGLWLSSTVPAAASNRFRVMAIAVRRSGSASGFAAQKPTLKSPERLMAEAECPDWSGHEWVNGESKLLVLPRTGQLTVGEKVARFIRPGLVEEYSVSVDGVRQDFLILERPTGKGPLHVELEVQGARAEPLVNGVRLIDNNGRNLNYSRLRVVDATDRELTARMACASDTKLQVVVEDANAIYPIRIDPTFSDANWFSMGTLYGADGYVNCSVTDASGNLYVGGNFGAVGDVVANRVAKWNGITWSALGSGLSSDVLALAVLGSDLYAGGAFTSAGGVTANRIAKWNGTSWSALGSGMAGLNPRVFALTVFGGELYAGGPFTSAGGVTVNCVARWNGSVWSALGSGMGGGPLTVNSLAVSGGNLYAGGGFTTAGGVSANNIAKWNGSAWSALGSGLNNQVGALAISGSDVYVGGGFSTAGGVAANRIAKWNGSAWSSLGSGMAGNLPEVDALAVTGGYLYAAGRFTTAGGVSAQSIAKWDGSVWSALTSGMSDDVKTLTVVGSDLYAGGYFTTAGGAPANYVAKWNGSAWVTTGSGLNAGVEALAVSGAELYAGGSFSTAGGVSANRIAKWNGSAWSPLGSGLNGDVGTLAVSGNDLYAGGGFTTAGGISANYVAKWDGSAWSALGSGMNNLVDELAVSGTNLYAGGYFTTAGGVAVNYVAKWNGSAWSSLGSGVSAAVRALAVSGSALYVGGEFTTAGGASANRIAKWDGSAWSALSSGMSHHVYALVVSGSDLYAGGGFTTAGGIPANYVAKWDGSAWSALGSGVSGSVVALAVSGNDLYAGGIFSSAGAVSANNLARWSGGAWSPLGQGVSAYVRALATSEIYLYAGGLFTVAGGKVSPYAARAAINGRLEVTLLPAGQNSGARWRRTGTAVWLESGATETLFGSDTYTIEFLSQSPSWLAPQITNVTVTAGSTTSVTGSYTFSPSPSDLGSCAPRYVTAPRTNNLSGPVNLTTGGPFCWDAGSERICFNSPGLVEVQWRDVNNTVFSVWYQVADISPGTYEVGQTIPRPTVVPAGSVPASGPTLVPVNSASGKGAVWHTAAQQLYATSPGDWTVWWTGTNATTCPLVSSRISIVWPTSAARYQVHVAGTPAVDLSNGGAIQWTELHYQEPGVGSSESEVHSQRTFSASGAGRSVLVLAPGNPLDGGTTNVYLQLIQTVAGNDLSYLTNQTTTIGQEIVPQSGWHATNFGGGYVLNFLSRYCTNFLNRAGRIGPIIPVNRDQTNATADDMVVVYYQAGTKLWNPASSNFLATPNIGWPYKPVRYDCQWPASPERIVIASQLGGSLQGLSNYKIYTQNDSGQPGFNPNDEHAFFWPSSGREPRLRLDRTNLMVIEGGATLTNGVLLPTGPSGFASAVISVTQPVTNDFTVSVSSLRDGAANLLASFSTTGIVTETTFTPQIFSKPLYFFALTNEDSAESIEGTNIFTVRASGGLFDQQTVFVREADTNRLGLVIDGLGVTVLEGSNVTVKVRLSQTPPGNVTVNLTKTFETNCSITSPAQLIFTSANWDTPQSLLIQSALDGDAANGLATYRVVASGGLAATNTIVVSEADGNEPPLAVYALRDDLGDRPGTSNPQYSEPYVLLTYDGAQGPAMKVFRVVAEESPYFFNYNGVAGWQIQPPYPLGAKFLGWETNSYATNTTVAWQDRKKFWWAKGAGADGGTSNIVMKFRYPVTDATFFFPEANRFGQSVPWLDRRANPGGTPTGIPTDVTNSIRWPDDTPSLLFGESLVKAKFGLPTIAGQKSVDVVYEQTQARGLPAGSSVKVIDAARTHEASLSALPSDTAGKTVVSLIQSGKAAPGSIFFTPLSPHLRSRFWYDPNSGNGKLKFTGQFVDEFGTVEPVGYLLLNVLTARDLAELRTLSTSGSPDSIAFQNALTDLAGGSKAGQPRYVPTNTVQRSDDTFGLTAGLATGTGYVTVAFNNVISPIDSLPADRGTPVSLQILRVVCPNYQGETKVIYPPDPFDEKVSLRHSGDFAGQGGGYQFQWEHHPGPGKPSTNSALWDQNLFLQGFGEADTVIVSAGTRTLSDWWYRSRWRTTNTANPCGTNWSAWTDPALVEGWIKRVSRNINFFDQRYTNLVNSSVDTIVDVLSQAGRRWVGAVPLDAEALKDTTQFGLIEIYETVLKRGIEMSIEGNPQVDEPGANRALLQVASQLANIYMLLGNEAYADAADPTIGFVTTGAGRSEYGVEASSYHSFMGQVNSVLDEELALLRGLSASPDVVVTDHPRYNRLDPNTQSGAEARAVYALNYGIRDVTGDGNANELDAAIFFPQGHGDAWGHYLMAIKNFYRLLRNDHFTWTVTNESVTLAGSATPVSVNYQHERRFAQAAAAKARTGAEIVNLTYRSQYVENPDGQWQGYLDTNTVRAWGLSEWASRAGQGAYFDWVVGNALLPPDSPGGETVKVDRTTVTELREVAGSYLSIQDELDKADAGLNPLGLARNVIPFDIDPARVDAGETHFEQIFERARKAMNNAIGVFNHANASTQRLREQSDSVQDFRNTVAERENDFTNRLVEVFGYPYAGDPTYAGNLNVPDLLHYMYSDYSEITGEVPPEPVPFTVNFVDTVVSPEGNLLRLTNAVTYHTAPNGFGLVKPGNWGQRRAPGEIQMAHSELLQGTARFKRAQREYENLLAQIEDQAILLQAQYGLDAEEISVLQAGVATQDNLNAAILRARERQLNFRNWAQKATLVANAVAEGSPSVFGVIGGLANGVIGDFTSPIRSAVKLAGAITTEILNQNADRQSLVELDHQQAKESAQALQNITLTALHHQQASEQQVKQLEQLVRQEALLRLEIYNQQEALQQSAGRYASTLARGQRLLEERLRFRQQTAARVQDYRYKDMAFRIFRNEALQQYRAQFDLAARYVYLAAAAYDYETNLRDAETRWKPGSSLLTDIVRARSIGVIDGNGNPQPGPGAGRRGDGGLAASLWAMGFNWNDPSRNLRGQLGFNNPARENLSFSLRAGLFRAVTNDFGDDSWRAWLTSCKVANIAELPEFVRYCKPPNEFGLGGRREPGLVIPFTSAIKYRHNFFGWPDTRGSANFSSSYFATKIKSVSVQFDGYDSVNLSTTPYVYVIPVGNDVMLAPITAGMPVAPTREWKILDQFLPATLSLTNAFSSFPSDSWIPISEMEGQNSFFAIRRYSQMRAYHGGINGTPTNPELEAYKRLIGRSVWNTRWLIIILGGDLDGINPDRGIQTFINGVSGNGEGVTDINLKYSTYSYQGN